MALEDTNGYDYSQFSDATYAVGYGGATVASNAAAAFNTSSGGGFWDSLGRTVTGGLSRLIDVEASVRLAEANRPTQVQGAPTGAADNTGGAGGYYQVPKPNQDMLLIGIIALVGVLIWKS